MNHRQRLFVEEYPKDLNAKQAAIRAGYSPRTAEQMGYQLLQKTSVSLTIQEAFQARSERTEITADMVVQGLLAEARDHDEGSSHSARVAAWAHLGKHLGMFHEPERASEQPVQITRVTVVVPATPKPPVVEGEAQIVDIDDGDEGK